jgi:hypothetical protein
VFDEGAQKAWLAVILTRVLHILWAVNIGGEGGRPSFRQSILVAKMGEHPSAVNIETVRGGHYFPPTLEKRTSSAKLLLLFDILLQAALLLSMAVLLLLHRRCQ